MYLSKVYFAPLARTQCAVAIRKTSYELVAASLIILLLPCIIHPHSTSPFKIWTNTFWNLDKYTLQFGQIHFASCTSQPPSSFSHVSFLHSWHPRRLEPVSKMHKFSTHKWRLFPSQPFTVKIFPVGQQDTCFHNHQRDVCKSEIAGFGQIAIHTYHWVYDVLPSKYNLCRYFRAKSLQQGTPM